MEFKEIATVMKHSTILLLFAGCLCACNPVGQNDTICDKYNERSAELLYNFFMNDEDTLFLNAALSCLDSALSYIEDGTLTCRYKQMWQTRKLSALSLKKAYSEGIEYLKQIDFNIVSAPYYKSTFLKRFHAMECQYKGDTICRNKHIKSILDDIEPFIEENREKIDLMCENEDENAIYQNPLFFSVQQYYYYKSLIEGVDVVEKELDLLEKNKNYNQGFLNGMKATFREDFLIFQGY